MLRFSTSCHVANGNSKCRPFFYDCFYSEILNFAYVIYVCVWRGYHFIAMCTQSEFIVKCVAWKCLICRECRMAGLLWTFIYSMDFVLLWCEKLLQFLWFPLNQQLEQMQSNKMHSFRFAFFLYFYFYFDPYVMLALMNHDFKVFRSIQGFCCNLIAK